MLPGSVRFCVSSGASGPIEQWPSDNCSNHRAPKIAKQNPMTQTSQPCQRDRAGGSATGAETPEPAVRPSIACQKWRMIRTSTTIETRIATELTMPGCSERKFASLVVNAGSMPGLCDSDGLAKKSVSHRAAVTKVQTITPLSGASSMSRTAGFLPGNRIRWEGGEATRASMAVAN